MKSFVSIVAFVWVVFAVSCAKESKESEATDTASMVNAERANVAAANVAAEAPAHECGDKAKEETCAGKEEGACCGGWDKVPVEHAQIPDNAEWTTLKVSGMSCGGCAKRIQASLTGIEGVIDIQVDHTTGEVKIAAAPGTQDVRGRVAPRLNELGYTVQDI